MRERPCLARSLMCVRDFLLPGDTLMAVHVSQAHSTNAGPAPADRKTVWWADEAVCLIDQTRLPFETVTITCTTLDDVAHAIRSMQVRGAPAIGVTAAYGVALVARQHPALCVS